MIRTQLAVVGFEDGGRGHKTRNMGGLLKLERVRKQDLLLEPLERNVACQHLDFNQVKYISNF